MLLNKSDVALSVLFSSRIDRVNNFFQFLGNKFGLRREQCERGEFLKKKQINEQMQRKYW